MSHESAEKWLIEFVEKEDLAALNPILHGRGGQKDPLANYHMLILRGCPKWADFS